MVSRETQPALLDLKNTFCFETLYHISWEIQTNKLIIIISVCKPQAYNNDTMTFLSLLALTSGIGNESKGVSREEWWGLWSAREFLKQDIYKH